ncbi:copper homeostasis periplasmic binding protein CopC [Bosea sp. LjRoot9]|uniref:copper homeostasis periplasmic binding protein CopC n=1 Tax=Bosea sp. LjRoot9 TaxID=3342341 RepID=UPI003ED01066
MNAFARAALAAAALLASTYGAVAHAHLKAQMPAADARVSASPAALSLAFSEGLEIGLCGVTLKGADGKVVATGAAALATDDDKRMTVPLDGALAAGTYTVEWHVLSKDGHPTRGAYQFTIGP